MRSLPWRVALRADRKAVVTTLGVAVAIAFALVSVAAPAALQFTPVADDGPFAETVFLVARADGAPFDQSLVASSDGVLVVLAQDVSGREVWLAAFAGAAEPAPGRAFAVEPAPLAFAALTPHELNVTARARDVLLGDDWVVVAEADLRAIAPSFEPGHVTYALVRDTPSDLPPDFVAASVPAARPFFALSAQEVAAGLVLIVTLASVLVALFVYEFVRSEVWARAHEIAIWRALGMRDADVVALLVARGMAITGAGLLVGAVAARGAVAVAGVPWPAQATLVGVVALAAAGVAGAALAARAVRQAPVDVRSEVGA